MNKSKKQDDIFLSKKTEEKQNKATIMILKLKLQGE